AAHRTVGRARGNTPGQEAILMTHPNLNVILGPPGCGKTTYQLDVMERELKAGVRPDKLAFLAFTKKAAEEAKTRARERFNFDDDALVYFRTLHSLAFRQLALRPSSVMQRSHYRELGDTLGLELTLEGPQDDSLYGMQTGDCIMYLETLARAKQVSLRSVWEDADEVDIDYRELDRYSRALAVYKRNHGLRDYTDMLEDFVYKAQAVAPTLDVLIVDEAQDLSWLQWQMVGAIAAKAQRVYVSGDDDQAIYKWAGADVDAFMGLRGSSRVLDQSYRIPATVHRLANIVLGRMSKRTEKVFKPRPEQGAINWYGVPQDVDMSTGTWLLLARN